MAVAEAKRRSSDEPLEPIRMSDAHDTGALPLVEDRKYFRCTLQLGPHTKWRKFAGGKWVEDTSVPREAGSKHYRVAPAIHNVGPITGSTLNGLITKHNAFLKANADKQSPEGLAQRMWLISDIREADAGDIPPDARENRTLPMRQLDLHNIISAAVHAALEAAQASDKK